jgi:hypothetical protein
MIKGIELIFIGLKLHIIEEGIEAFKVHSIDILLFNTLSQNGLIGKANSSASLTRSELIVIYDVKNVTLLL